jgi:hypothetical protein
MPERFSRLGWLLTAAVLLLWTGACAAPAAEQPAPTAASISTSAAEAPTAASIEPTHLPGEPTSTLELPTIVPGQPTAAPGQPTAAPEILEKRRLTLEWPPSIRSGDGDVVRLTLDVDAAGNLVPTAEIAGHQTTAQTVQIPNLFNTHHVLAEARLDLAGVQVDPQGLVSQTLLPGQSVEFSWSVKPEGVGTFRGNVWFYLRFIPINGGLESERTISAQPIQIRSVDLLGLSGTPARVVGVLGTLVGSMFGLDNLVSWVWKLIRRKKGT